MRISTTLLISLQLLIALSLTISLTPSHEGDAEFCWKDSYGRGVGTIPSVCSNGRVKIGLLCYSPCPSGYTRFGFDCHTNCPSNFRDDGLFCRLSEYGRGAGFAYWASDWFSNKGMFRRCEAANGAGNCEQWGAVVYPKCKSGYYAVGCCICRPNTPNCGALGLGGQVDLSCAKKIKIGDPVPMDCPSGTEKNAGLCYKACSDQMFGVGPVCWGGPPAGWVECGMGASVDSKTCASIIWDQVSAVGGMALSIATMGSSSAITKATQAGKNAERIIEMKKKLETMQKYLEKADTFKGYIEKAMGQL
jgi:hypothetical protein